MGIDAVRSVEKLFQTFTISGSNSHRENEKLSKYGESKSAINVMLMEFKKLIEATTTFETSSNSLDLKHLVS